MKFLLSLVLATCFSIPAFALDQAGAKNAVADLNRASPGAMQKHKLGKKLLAEQVLTLKAVYDFSVKGGAQSTIGLVDYETGLAVKLPKGAIVRDCLLDFETAATSGGSATISVGTGMATNDLKNALAVASATGLVACIPVGTAATAIKITSDKQPSITIGTADLTAGKLYVFIDYVLATTL